jgi:hypothetical protein
MIKFALLAFLLLVAYFIPEDGANLFDRNLDEIQLTYTTSFSRRKVLFIAMAARILTRIKDLRDL